MVRKRTRRARRRAQHLVVDALGAREADLEVGRLKKYRSVEMPSVLTLSGRKEREILIASIEKLREFVRAGETTVLDFRRTKKVFSDGMILLLAEVDRLQRIFGSAKLCGTRPREVIAAQALDHVGLSRMLQIGLPPRKSQLHASVKHWRYATGTNADTQAVAPLAVYLDERGLTSVRQALYRGISEAMTNAVYHAYTEPRGDGIDSIPAVGKRWWMFFQIADERLSVSFCDLGIGIHRSLRASAEWREILQLTLDLLEPSPKAQEIKTAIETSRTRTKKGHRGKGLKDIQRVIKGARKGHLWVTSDVGEYVFWIDDSGLERERLADLDAKVQGTIVTWTVPLGRN